VLLVAAAIMTLMLVFVIPRFKTVFDGLLGGAPMPAFTSLVLNLSDFAKNHFLIAATGLFLAMIGFTLALKTHTGRLVFDQFKLDHPSLDRYFANSPSPASPAPWAPCSVVACPCCRH